jgi:glyoxylase-like metal-dependent hydrolase (beta-lactamase superfamily II)
MLRRSLSSLLAAACLSVPGPAGALENPVVSGSPGPVATRLAAGVDLIRGRFVPGAQPDGNSVVLSAPEGLIVIDTGRHVDHTQVILDVATKEGVPIAAVINTHWHLDHTGGNPRIRRASPDVTIWASGAIAEARTGFLADYRGQLVAAIAGTDDPAARAAWEAEVAIIDAGQALAPDEVVTAGGQHTIAGRRLEIGLESHAVTAADVWVLDPATGVLAAGDLVTLPVPLFDTACPKGWLAALGHLAGANFELLVPGHGAPMTREEFEIYRDGFQSFLDCADSDRPEQVCIDGWLRDLGPLIPESDRDFARMLLQYYVPNSLRAAADKTARLCGDGVTGS